MFVFRDAVNHLRVVVSKGGEDGLYGGWAILFGRRMPHVSPSGILILFLWGKSILFHQLDTEILSAVNISFSS